ncbi:ABC transporter permease [Actinoalloteichus sp. AHMU CJ021]|uniref:ABC transporter permease n=1 Tax=Actinoalloteichus TaxID=65496 RepID=UPI0004AB5211|nr:ABC transporter permease [Actinoalloteichus caeruleus]AUS78865.1 ABC transporter permease [Actinoalloteichus sp. AHMU CJ021]
MTLLAVERIKLFSTRSPWWCMVVAVGLTVGFTALMSGFANEQGTVTVGFTQFSYQFGLMVLMVMAVLAVTTEYRFGTIRTTFQTAPNRAAVLTAKALLVAVLAGVVALAAAFLSFWVSDLLATNSDLSLSGADAWRNVAGTGLVAFLAAVLSVAVGILLRQSAAAVTVVLVWPLLVEGLVSLIPRIGQDIQSWMPFVAAHHFLFGGQPDSAEAAMMMGMSDVPYGPWAGIAYFGAISVGLFVVAVITASRRDA